MTGELKQFQAIGRHPRDGKSMHNYGIAMDLALFPHDYKGWRTPDPRIIPLEISSDRVVASMLALIAAQKIAMNSTLGIPKEKIGRPSIDRITDMSLFEDMLLFSKFLYRSKYKPMYKFKNSFAASGSIINLLRFEQELIKLGYGVLPGASDVFNYRGINGGPATFITVGLHTRKGIFTPAMNNGSAEIRFDLDTAFDEAVKYAAQLEPLFVTQDGVEIFDTKTKVYGLKKADFTDEYNHYPAGQTYRGHVIVETNFSLQVSPNYKWFSSYAAAKKHVDKTVPYLVTEDGVPKFEGDNVWYVRPNFVYHYWRSGIKESVVNSIKQGYKFFDKEEGCIEYIKRNKPFFNLSQNEMQEFLNGFLKPLGLETQVEALEFPKDFVKRD